MFSAVILRVKMTKWQELTFFVLGLTIITLLGNANLHSLSLINECA